MNIKDDFILKEINDGYLVGGAVRDFFLGKQTFDRDIVINGAEIFAKKITEKFEGTFIPLDEENKIYRVVLKDKENFLDISEIQGNSIEEDLMRRDFTINSIAYDLKNLEYVDITNGIQDIKDKKLRYIKEENFIDDPLRILRAFRFFATTGFEMDYKLKEVLQKYSNLALNPAKERIHYELMKLFGGQNASSALIELDQIGLLEKIFPCVIEMKKVPKNTHHHLDLFNHLVESVKQVELQYLNSENEIKTHLDAIDFGGFPRINHLKIATFLHDIGKFSTWTIEESGRHRFIGHDNIGAKLVVPLLKELKFSKKQIEYISKMIKYHIYPSGVIASPELNEKVMMRYLRKMEDDVIDNIILAKADRLSARGPAITNDIIKSNIDGLDKLLSFYLEQKDKMEPLPKLLDGNEIMCILNITPSKELGKIIKLLAEAQLNDEVVTKDDAIKFIRDIHENSTNQF